MSSIGVGDLPPVSGIFGISIMSPAFSPDFGKIGNFETAIGSAGM